MAHAGEQSVLVKVSMKPTTRLDIGRWQPYGPARANISRLVVFAKLALWMRNLSRLLPALADRLDLTLLPDHREPWG
jgi:hypothetical protein